MSHLDKKPITHITLLPGEVHLHSAVLVRLAPMKMFGFAGPKAYQAPPLSPRFRAHITDRRLLMEIYPYSAKERTATKWAIAGTSMLLGQFAHTPQAHAQVGLEKMMYNAAMNKNLAIAGDPDAQYAAIPYDILTVTSVAAVANLGRSYIKLEIPGIKEEMVFMACLDTEGRLLAKGNIVDNAKVEWRLSPEFVGICQEAISSYRSRATIGGFDPAKLPAATLLPAAPPAPSVVIICPGCKTRLQVAAGSRIVTCGRCRKVIVFNSCLATHVTYAVLSEWTSWRCPGCKAAHKVIRPSPNGHGERDKVGEAIFGSDPPAGPKWWCQPSQ